MKHNKTRQGYARFILEALKADKIIASDEINTIQSILEKRGITDDDIRRSSVMTMEEAFEAIVNHKKAAKNLLSDLNEIITSDGFCSREEALFLTALHYCLENSHRTQCSILSFHCGDTDFEDSQVLYLENGCDTIINQCITSNKNPNSETISTPAITNELRIGGFEFVYIPSIASNYKNANKALLASASHYLSPTLSDNEIDKVITMLQQLSTQSFLSEVLEPHFGCDIEIKEPSLLFKLGNSWVNSTLAPQDAKHEKHIIKHTDFLLMKVSSEIIEEVREFITTLNNYRKEYIVTVNNMREATGNFLYAGFHKTLIDMVLLKRGERNRIVLTRSKGVYKISFTGENAKPLKNLDPRHAAMYMLIIRESLSREGEAIFKHSHLRRLKDTYQSFYKKFRDSDKAPKIEDTELRRTILTKINSEYLGKHHIFRTMSRGQDHFRVNIDPEFIIVREGSLDTPITAHNDWKKLFQQ